VVTTAGIVFGITMFALAGSCVLSIAQVGTTIAHCASRPVVLVANLEADAPSPL
jgi:hypothetical protein